MWEFESKLFSLFLNSSRQWFPKVQWSKSNSFKVASSVFQNGGAQESQEEETERYILLSPCEFTIIPEVAMLQGLGTSV